MSVYYQKYKAILELKRSVNGVEQDLDEQEREEPNDYTNTEEQDNDNEPPEDQNNDNDTGGEQEEPEEENNEEEPEEDNNTEEEPEEDEHADDDTEANDYNSDLDAETEENDDEEPETEGGTAEEKETTGSADISEDEIKQMEQELFKSVPAEQMAIKVLELKKQYLEAYNTISNILIRVNKITKTSSNMKILEFVTNKLLELKDLIKFYMTNTFDTKSFIENNINYQQYLSTLNTINKIFKEIKDKNEDK